MHQGAGYGCGQLGPHPTSDVLKDCVKHTSDLFHWGWANGVIYSLTPVLIDNCPWERRLIGHRGQRQLRGRKEARVWDLKLLVWMGTCTKAEGGSVTEHWGALTISPSEALPRTADPHTAPGGLCPLDVPWCVGAEKSWEPFGYRIALSTSIVLSEYDFFSPFTVNQCIGSYLSSVLTFSGFAFAGNRNWEVAPRQRCPRAEKFQQREFPSQRSAYPWGWKFRA